jgi:hypothetical protein
MACSALMLPVLVHHLDYSFGPGARQNLVFAELRTLLSDDTTGESPVPP